MYASVAGNTSKGFQLRQRHVEEVGCALSGSFHMQAGAQLRILGGETNRTVANAANAILLAGGGNQGRAGNGNSVGA